MKKQSKILIIIAGGILLAVTIAITAVLMVSGSDSRKYQKHMEAAQQYLDELQYEQAITEYELAIEIEPNNIEAYQALAELYVKMEGYDSAIEVLNRGIEQTGSEKLADYLEEIQRTLEEKQAQITVQESEAENSPKEERGYWESGDVKGYIIYKYDEQRNIIKENLHYNDDTLSYYLTYEYDAKGNCVKTTGYYSDGTIDEIYENEYDENGNRIRETWHCVHETIGNYAVFEYDENGNQTKATWYNEDGTLFK